MKKQYEIAVIGGGPAGGMAAWKAAGMGALTILLERDREIGIPVRCGEMATLDVFERYFPITEKLIANRIIAEEFISPDFQSTLIKLGDKSVILERKFFDAYIVEQAGKAGAEIYTLADVSGMKRIETGWEIRITHNGLHKKIKANLVIAADGVESQVARWAGIKTTLSLNDLISAAQYDLTNLKIKHPQHCLFYFGNSLAPGGYIWVFPKTSTRANVGAGILASRSCGNTAKHYLDIFIKKHLPEGKPVGLVTGGIPVAQQLKELVADNLLIVGDAARLTDPITTAGIRHAAISGVNAGEVSGKAIQVKKYNKKYLSKYSRLWKKEIGNKQKINYKIKNNVLKMNDKELCRINGLARKASSEKMTLTKFLKLVIKSNPKLLAEIFIFK